MAMTATHLEKAYDKHVRWCRYDFRDMGLYERAYSEMAYLSRERVQSHGVWCRPDATDYIINT
jgi:hypothetical protein